MALKDAIADAVGSARDALHIPGGAPDPDTSAAEHEAQGEADPEAAEALETAPHGDAIALLKADHRRVEALFKTALSDKSSTLSGQRKIVAQILTELALHAKIEESIVYPAVYGKTKRDTDERLEVLEAVEEHGSMKDLMRKIAKARGRDETLKAKVQVLMEIVEHHVKEEESSFFPDAKKLLGEKRLTEIGDQIVKIKARAARRGGAGSTSRKKSSTRKITRKRA